MPQELTLFFVCRGCSNDSLPSALTVRGEAEMENVAYILKGLCVISENKARPKLTKENTLLFTSPTKQEIRSAEIIAAKLGLEKEQVIDWLREENIFPQLCFHGLCDKNCLPLDPRIVNIIVVTEKNTLQKILQIFNAPPLHVESGSLWKINLPVGNIVRLDNPPP